MVPTTCANCGQAFYARAESEWATCPECGHGNSRVTGTAAATTITPLDASASSPTTAAHGETFVLHGCTCRPCPIHGATKA